MWVNSLSIFVYISSGAAQGGGDAVSPDGVERRAPDPVRQVVGHSCTDVQTCRCVIK